ncbi:hypothetical protein [uncultured Nostoc sp.]|uniref:hypothetical protein n=1 Tax=uncultured Nostoc sp. TaxID=340711 RepID=UPI0035CC5E5A
MGKYQPSQLNSVRRARRNKYLQDGLSAQHHNPGFQPTMKMSLFSLGIVTMKPDGALILMLLPLPPVRAVRAVVKI